ncbi:hypothetical protein [Halobacillus litoralis]|uniref:hypothetical protein n=1 Tax=Halobacillus litoralis TaxID=45668 RepID=UPI001CD7B087|nr:hypothetical protein [Halobacillus litoralis]MCA1021793.1 hypothetical protein [Halobacillus litoralis]
MAYLTVDDIKKQLDELGVEYGDDLLRDDLFSLLEKHQDGSQEEDNQATGNDSSPSKETEKTSYEVIQDFKDLQDKDKIYHKGDKYPSDVNTEVTDERSEELLSDKNKQGRAVIKEV